MHSCPTANGFDRRSPVGRRGGGSLGHAHPGLARLELGRPAASPSAVSAVTGATAPRAAAIRAARAPEGGDLVFHCGHPVLRRALGGEHVVGVVEDALIVVLEGPPGYGCLD